MEYAIAVLERVRAKLAALPKPDERNKKLSKQDSVGFLAKNWVASLRNGHTIEEIAFVPAAEGVKMSPVAVKNYLQRSAALDGSVLGQIVPHPSHLRRRRRGAPLKAVRQA
jgi:hypothetical protein